MCDPALSGGGLCAVPASTVGQGRACCAATANATSILPPDPGAPIESPEALIQLLSDQPELLLELVPNPELPGVKPPKDSGGQIEPDQAASSRRRKLWEIDHKYHCPIIGTCLSVEELRRIGRNHVWRTEGRPNDYEVHVGFVASATHRNGLAIATQKLLERKYGPTIRRFQQAANADALRDKWEAAMASGEVPGALWAVMTHPKTDAALLCRVYEDVHMLSHQIGAGQRMDLKRLAETREELERLRLRFERAQRRAAQQAVSLESSLSDVQAQLQERTGECEALRREVQSLGTSLASSGGAELDASQEALEAELNSLRQALERQAEDAALWRERWASIDTERSELRARYQEKVEECEALERLIERDMMQSCAQCEEDSCCARADLAGRLVLCVGGHKPLVEKYRLLVARCNGRFDHHDGGMEDSHHRLESKLASADAVVCAADFVSHTAYYRTKRFCKRTYKPHVLLGNSGISSFARALEQVVS